MEAVTIYLRTALFSFGHPDAHVPNGVTVIEGRIIDRPSGGVTVETDVMRDDRGRELSEAVLTLQLPWAKVDHILVHDEDA